MIRQELWLKSKQIAKVIDVQNRKNIKHIKYSASREQKRRLPQLTDSELALLARLIPYMCWETNMLVGDGELGKKNHPLSWSQIDAILRISKPHRIKTVRSLEEKNLIGYYTMDGKRAGIAINPKFAFNGYKPAKELLRIFGLDDGTDEGQTEEPRG